MAIKSESQGTIPSVDLTYVQYNQVHITTRNVEPYTISVSGEVQLYGVDANGVRYYDKTLYTVAIQDLKAYIATLSSDDQTLASDALAKVQEGLGVLAQLKLGINFVAVE